MPSRFVKLTLFFDSEAEAAGRCGTCPCRQSGGNAPVPAARRAPAVLLLARHPRDRLLATGQRRPPRLLQMDQLQSHHRRPRGVRTRLQALLLPRPSSLAMGAVTRSVHHTQVCDSRSLAGQFAVRVRGSRLCRHGCSGVARVRLASHAGARYDRRHVADVL